MAEPKTRIGGSGFTTMLYKGSRLAYLQTVVDTPPRGVGDVTPIQPIDEPVPLEIVIPAAVGAGTLQCTFFELWNEPVWSMLPGLEGTNNLLDVLKRQMTTGEITMRKIIKSPSGIMRAKVYHGVVITDVNEGEQINISTMSLPKTLTMMYTYSTPI